MENLGRVYAGNLYSLIETAIIISRVEADNQASIFRISILAPKAPISKPISNPEQAENCLYTGSNCGLQESTLRDVFFHVYVTETTVFGYDMNAEAIQSAGRLMSPPPVQHLP